MASITFTRSTTIPTSAPAFDPRTGSGISFHADLTNREIWLGVSKTGIRWAKFQSQETRQPAIDSVGNFIRDYPFITSSSTLPDFSPRHFLGSGKVHIHVSYLTETYVMLLGTNANTWIRFNTNEYIS